jgi:hypothetical protein
MSAIRDMLVTGLEMVAAQLPEDELAYLALTSKPEHALRDRLAWRLHQAVGDHLVVAREWRRVDLAVLDRDQPVALVEAKSFYAFDAIRPGHRASWLAKMQADVTKATRLSTTSEVYVLAFVTNLEGSIGAHLRNRVVKYASGIEKALKQVGTEPAAFNRKAAEDLRRDIAEWDREMTHVRFDAGRAWDITVSVDAYLIGPF